MKINYRILKVNELEHSIIVRYYTDIVTEQYLASEKYPDGSCDLTPEGYPIRCRTDYNFNIWETPSPSEERIVEIIMNGAPKEWLHLHEQILSSNVDTSLSEIKSLESTANSFVVTI